MNNIYIFCIYFALLFVLMAIYFKIAQRFNIIDRPNQRSSHALITVRGGGIIFPISAAIYFLYFDFDYPWFLSALLLISLVSFIDDIRELDGKIRLVFQLIAVVLLFLQADLLKMPIYFLVPLLIVVIAVVNAWNFMDGINGLNGGYSLLVIFTLIYINDFVVHFSENGFMIAIALSLLVFIFYNSRTQARCFAGDIGSVSIAMIIIFLMIALLIRSQNINYILFVLLYGLDSATTLFFRLIRKENILEAHRSHFYQYLANEYGFAHNTVSLIYIFIQLIVNAIVVYFATTSVWFFVVAISVTLIIFVALRFKLEGKNRLIGNMS